MGELEGFERKLDRTEGDAIPVGYITNLHSIVVDINNSVADISGL